MKVILATTIVPFIKGGGTMIVDMLAMKLREYGHEVADIRIPFHSYYLDMPEQMLAIRLLDVTRHGDRLICVRTPSYLLRHPHKVLWFIHHHRPAYDLWDTVYGMSHAPMGRIFREYFIRADELAFRESERIFTNSKEMSRRLREYNGIDSKVLYPPLLTPENFSCKSYGDYIFYPSRICPAKRQGMAAEAMRYTRTPVKLVIAGKYDTEECCSDLAQNLRGLKDKVILIDRWISEKEKFELFANSLAVCYIPMLEDSYGYVSLEAAYSRKTVISCLDSGGTNELLKHGANGFLTESNPKALAECFDELYDNKQKAQNMGDSLLDRVKELKIDWDTVIGGLTG